MRIGLRTLKFLKFRNRIAQFINLELQVYHVPYYSSDNEQCNEYP